MHVLTLWVSSGEYRFFFKLAKMFKWK